MEDFLAPASHLIGAELPGRLWWEHSGRRAFRRLLVRLFAVCTTATLAVAGWQWLLAQAGAPSPVVPHTVRGAHAVTVVARAASEVAVAVAERQVFAPLRQLDAWTHRRYDAGEASYYARGFEGRSTASGEPYRAAKYTAAHRTLPFGTLLRVTNERNGRSVVVRVNDRGPFHARRVVDLSRAAAAELGLVRRGRGQVRLDVLTR